MGFELLSSKPRQRRFEIGCFGMILVAVLALYARAQLIDRDAAAICAAAPIGSVFDGADFKRRAEAAGFRASVWQSNKPDQHAMAHKSIFGFLRGACWVELRDGVVTNVEAGRFD